MAEGLDRQHMNKCGHDACSCMVEPGQSYCSDSCARHSSAQGAQELPGKAREGTCNCGHPDCGKGAA